MINDRFSGTTVGESGTLLSILGADIAEWSEHLLPINSHKAAPKNDHDDDDLHDGTRVGAAVGDSEGIPLGDTTNKNDKSI